MRFFGRSLLHQGLGKTICAACHSAHLAPVEGRVSVLLKKGAGGIGLLWQRVQSFREQFIDIVEPALPEVFVNGRFDFRFDFDGHAFTLPLDGLPCKLKHSSKNGNAVHQPALGCLFPFASHAGGHLFPYRFVVS